MENSTAASYGNNLSVREPVFSTPSGSETEQEALIDGFGRLLNALDAPVSFHVRSNRADLRGLIEGIEERSVGLPHSHLEPPHVSTLGSFARSRPGVTSSHDRCSSASESPAMRRTSRAPGSPIGSRKPRRSFVVSGSG